MSRLGKFAAISVAVVLTCALFGVTAWLDAKGVNVNVLKGLGASIAGVGVSVEEYRRLWHKRRFWLMAFALGVSGWIASVAVLDLLDATQSWFIAVFVIAIAETLVSYLSFGRAEAWICRPGDSATGHKARRRNR